MRVGEAWYLYCKIGSVDMSLAWTQCTSKKCDTVSTIMRPIIVFLYDASLLDMFTLRIFFGEKFLNVTKVWHNVMGSNF